MYTLWPIYRTGAYFLDFFYLPYWDDPGPRTLQKLHVWGRNVAGVVVWVMPPYLAIEFLRKHAWKRQTLAFGQKWNVCSSVVHLRFTLGDFIRYLLLHRDALLPGE